MRVTVCELNNDPESLAADWRRLTDHTTRQCSDLVLLPEMPFSRWLAGSREAEVEAWSKAVCDHAKWCNRLPELGAATVVGTRPVIDRGIRYNEVFVWADGAQIADVVHRKSYLPDEDGFWEATWYERGNRSFDPVEVRGVRLGFMICTEMWFTAHARDLGKCGVQLLLTPRATAVGSVDKWLAGGRVAAVVSGAYSLSTNFSGNASAAGTWGGTGWIVEPEEGEVLGTTSPNNPFLTIDIDLGVADAAKTTYPRYVAD